MKILLLSGSMPEMKCGVGDYTALLAGKLAELSNVEVGVITAAEANPHSCGRAVKIFPMISSWNLSNVRKLLRHARHWLPDIVHVQYPTQGYKNSWWPNFLPLLFRLSGFTVVQTWHEPPNRYKYFPNALTRDSLIVVEKKYLETVLPRYRRLITRKKNHFIPIAANIPQVKLSHEERLAVRGKFMTGNTNLVAYFGFVSEPKGVEHIFKAADPTRDTIILICELNELDSYQKSILDIINSKPWAGKVQVTGFLRPMEVAEILAAVDAVVFPFKKGVAIRNGSFLAAQVQGTFTLTTAYERAGYDATENTYYAQPGNTAEMRKALRKYAGARLSTDKPRIMDWADIAKAHLAVYNEIFEAGCGIGRLRKER